MQFKNITENLKDTFDQKTKAFNFKNKNNQWHRNIIQWLKPSLKGAKPSKNVSQVRWKPLFLNTGYKNDSTYLRKMGWAISKNNTCIEKEEVPLVKWIKESAERKRGRVKLHQMVVILR